jgi:hypothetical protein
LSLSVRNCIVLGERICDKSWAVGTESNSVVTYVRGNIVVHKCLIMKRHINTIYIALSTIIIWSPGGEDRRKGKE